MRDDSKKGCDKRHNRLQTCVKYRVARGRRNEWNWRRLRLRMRRENLMTVVLEGWWNQGRECTDGEIALRKVAKNSKQDISSRRVGLFFKCCDGGRGNRSRVFWKSKRKIFYHFESFVDILKLWILFLFAQIFDKYF